MFENVVIKGIHASRYVMSWIRVGGKLSWRAGYSEFNNWLKALGLSEEEVDIIVEIARNGKMELEMSARHYLKTIGQETEG